MRPYVFADSTRCFQFKALQRKTDAARDALLEAEGVSLKRHQLIQKVKEELANASARQNAQQTDGQLAPPPSRNATTQSSMRSKAKKQRTADVQKSEFSCQTEFAAQRNSLGMRMISRTMDKCLFRFGHKHET